MQLIKKHPEVMCVNFFSPDGSNGKYEVKRNGPFDPYFLLVKNLQYTDRGFYYCCLPTNCSDSVDGCQRFILRVRGKLNPMTRKNRLALDTVKYYKSGNAIYLMISFLIGHFVDFTHQTADDFTKFLGVKGLIL